MLNLCNARLLEKSLFINGIILLPYTSPGFLTSGSPRLPKGQLRKTGAHKWSMGNWRELASLQPFGWDSNSAEPVGQSLLRDFQGLTSGRPQRRRQSAPARSCQASQQGQDGLSASELAAKGEDLQPLARLASKHAR
ncbi:hypothetical protein WJX84_006923 [Apatococcus fuscideae]|uniref:Uncharacterized protein n=1 Tax=Apatococcus fuscideae TaxID=2026836 RepID=A0AAW1SUL5_9CHLO